jgi:hypothetical protein
MKTPAIPQTYAQWRHCIDIEVECGIALTAALIDERLAVWRIETHDESRRFAQLYGDAHRLHVQQWFEQAHRAMT